MLNEVETRDLRAFAGVMIPASAAYKMPGADDELIFADIVKSIGRDLDDVKAALKGLAGIAALLRTSAWPSPMPSGPTTRAWRSRSRASSCFAITATIASCVRWARSRARPSPKAMSSSRATGRCSIRSRRAGRSGARFPEAGRCAGGGYRRSTTPSPSSRGQRRPRAAR